MSDNNLYHLEHSDANSRISIHEAVCAERYGNITQVMQGMSVRIGKLEALIWVVAGALILGMGGLIITLALRGHP